MSRSQAFKTISMDDYRASMQGIYSESLSEDTKDESPMVYKTMNEIIENIRDTVNIVNVIKPVYNFKAAEQINAGNKPQNLRLIPPNCLLQKLLFRAGTGVFP